MAISKTSNKEFFNVIAYTVRNVSQKLFFSVAFLALGQSHVYSSDVTLEDKGKLNLVSNHNNPR